MIEHHNISSDFLSVETEARSMHQWTKNLFSL